MLKIYTYQGCSTCRNAVRWLKERGIAFDEHPIRDTPPSVTELKTVLNAVGTLRALFNTSGQDYRALNLKERLPALTEAEALQLLSENGNLVKRPFVLDPERGVYLTGFKPQEWETALLS
jgi:arsenate reductase